MILKTLHIKDYNYALPGDRIAAFPLEERDQSKLLVYDSGNISDAVFHELPDLISPDTALVFNDTKVIEARLFFEKASGGVIEIFCLEPASEPVELALRKKSSCEWKCLIGGASKWKPGQLLLKNIAVENHQAELTAAYIRKEEDYFIVRFQWSPGKIPFGDILHAAGAIPLPPYIKRRAEHIDEARYQTVFSKHDGSVAAPTAALHFTDHVLMELQKKGIDQHFLTLHVGAGTFKPVKTETVAEHHMHSEAFSVKRSFLENICSSEKITAVGTTSLRTLESLYWLGVKTAAGEQPLTLQQWEPYELNQHMTWQASYRTLLEWMSVNGVDELHCRTSMIIVPGYTFKVASELITNFHQPQSTLLLLIAAFVGDDWKKIYQHALNNDYRFLSYGDSSYLRPAATQ